MLRISGVLSILLTRRTKDNTVNKSKATDPVRIKEAIRFSTTYKNDGNITQAIAITNRLLPVSSPLFTTNSMRRFDAIINVEQMKKGFLIHIIYLAYYSILIDDFGQYFFQQIF